MERPSAVTAPFNHGAASHTLPNHNSGEAEENLRFVNLLILVARPKGFEPLTPRFVVWCSIQLSYGRVAARRISPGAAEAAV